jgi:metal transporter CNNM
MDLVVIIVLITFSALCASLNTAIMRSDIGTLRRKVKLGDVYAKKIYHVRKKGLLANAALILTTVILNAVLSVYLAQFLSPLFAIGTSIALIFIFGEMIPQALAGRYTFWIGAYGAWIVQGLIWLLYPIIAPFAWLVQKIIGKETGESLSKQELIENIKEHSADDFEKEDQLTNYEQQIAVSALAFGNVIVETCMTPKKDVVSVRDDTLLEASVLKQLSETGHSRFPVQDTQGNAVGILVLKDIATHTLPVSVRDVMHPSVMTVHIHDSLEHVFMRGISQKIRLFPVLNQLDRFVGILTFEDIFEHMTGVDLPDEK